MTSEAESGTERDTGGTRSGTAEALGRFVSGGTIRFRYLVLSLGLAAVWWQVLGAFSAFVAGLGFVTLSFGIQGAIRLVASRRWPTTEAVVAESRVLTPGQAATYLRERGADGVSRAAVGAASGYVPLVRYEYTVDGRRYENAGISPFDGPISRRSWAAALVQSLPRGKPVAVRHHPEDPSNAYLRPWIRSSGLTFGAIGLGFLLIAGWFTAGMPGGAPVVAFSIGLPVLAIGLHRVRLGRRSRSWPTVDGVVTATGVETRSGGEDASTTYVPTVRYEYRVDGTTYVSSRFSVGGKPPGFDDRQAASAWLEEHCPVDGTVTVHYDPELPDRSVLRPGTSRSLLTVVVGLVFVGLGVVMVLVPDFASV